jgi:hypothetical protein
MFSIFIFAFAGSTHDVPFDRIGHIPVQQSIHGDDSTAISSSSTGILALVG